MKRFSWLLAVAVVLSGGARAAETATPGAPSPEGLPDTKLSLYPGSVFEVPNPTGFAWNEVDPGGNPRLPRPYATAPPRIPHGVADYLPITLAANPCLDCHALGAGADAPELPDSHRTDLRRAPEKVLPTVAGARWVCVSCHVPTSDAKPLRGNAAAPR